WTRYGDHRDSLGILRHPPADGRPGPVTIRGALESTKPGFSADTCSPRALLRARAPGPALEGEALRRRVAGGVAAHGASTVDQDERRHTAHGVGQEGLPVLVDCHRGRKRPGMAGEEGIQPAAILVADGDDLDAALALEGGDLGQRRLADGAPG